MVAMTFLQCCIYFLCSDVSGTKQFTLGTTPMTWAQSVAYCRQYYHDLAMIENSDKNLEVLNAVGGSSVWTGLYREPWRWSDNSNTSFRSWLNGEPNNKNGLEHCTAQRSNLLWADLSCDLQLLFVCYESKTLSLNVTNTILYTVYIYNIFTSTNTSFMNFHTAWKRKSFTTIKIKLQSSADLSDPTINS